MIPGLSGSALSHDALLANGFAEGVDGEGSAVHRQIARWHATIARTAGPAWSARQVFDGVVRPFCAALGFAVVPAGGGREILHVRLLSGTRAVAAVVASHWGQNPAALWREGMHLALALGLRWCFGFNGPSMRLFDAHRTHSRRYTELDLSYVASDPATFALVWRLLHARGFSGPGDTHFERALLLSERHRVAVRESLQAGVQEALTTLTTAFVSATRRRHAKPAPQQAFDESLVVVYRVLFLLFAEARGLVPTWHPVFRESYTIEAMRAGLEGRGRARGVWPALQAIARLAHRGCRAGTLRVPPFNGRLFSPAHAPLADALPLDERQVQAALAALTTQRTRDGVQPIAYGDLGVEHLGGVYERVLDFDVDTAGGRARLVRGGTRKSTGSFYTPRSLTEYLVRRALAPLVQNRDPEGLLRLRIVDPAMGSGAFLVAACRYLAHAYEAALIESGAVTAADISEAERAHFRRVVAQRCLYGVDVNPMAVQLARLSLWLATLAADRPLTFFDHRLRVGNSLAGASIDDVRRGTARPPSRSTLPLFLDSGLDRDVEAAITSHRELREAQEDSLEQVRAKERLFARLNSGTGPLARWKSVADLWCSAWFEPAARRMPRAVFRDLLESGGALPEGVSTPLLTSAAAVAARERFFHWMLEFPDVFADGGFDAVIGNPPWDVLRAGATGLARFSRGSGCYDAQSSGHANLYQLFAERSVSIVRRGGRLGLVLPSGFATDHGCARLRRRLLDATSVDSFVVVDNREALFPIHRGLKFVLLTATREGATGALPCRYGVRRAADFDRLPEAGHDPQTVSLSREMLERISGEQLAVPELPTALDAALVARLTLCHPRAGEPGGWGLRFGRELNATDDKEHFQTTAGGALPVVEGKQVQPFTASLRDSRQFIGRDVAGRLLSARPFERPRLAYRDVAAASNRLTLIAAVLPAGTVTTHTLFCLKTPLDEQTQHVLCGLFNSYVANYLVRTRVSTHVTAAIIDRLPLPVAPRDGESFSEMHALALRLAGDPGDAGAAASHQALAARMYGLSQTEFEHVLSTFPLVDRADRDRALRMFVDRL